MMNFTNLVSVVSLVILGIVFDICMAFFLWRNTWIYEFFNFVSRDKVSRSHS